MTLPKTNILADVLEHRALNSDMWFIRLFAPTIARQAIPGQFVEVSIPGGAFILRRPLGVAEVLQDSEIVLVYRAVGAGTKALTTAKIGDKVSLVGPLGKGFSRFLSNPLLVGGGVGLSPLLFYAQQEKPVSVLMGGRTHEELFWKELYKAYSDEIFITTDDGSLGVKGFVTTLLPDLLASGKYDFVIVCGPNVMMRSVADIAKDYNIPCEVSLERRMACGLGACLSCSVDTINGRKKVCKDGPVFRAEEVFL